MEALEGFLVELRNWCESVRPKGSLKDLGKQVGLRRWVDDIPTVFVREGNGLTFQARVLLAKQFLRICRSASDQIDLKCYSRLPLYITSSVALSTVYFKSNVRFRFDISLPGSIP